MSEERGTPKKGVAVGRGPAPTVPPPPAPTPDRSNAEQQQIKAELAAHQWLATASPIAVVVRLLTALHAAEQRAERAEGERDRLRGTLDTILAWHRVKDDAEYDGDEGGEPETITYCAACHSTDEWCETELLIDAALETDQ